MTAATSQVARASTTTDDQGPRRPTLLFKPGTTATMTLDGGATPLPPPWTVRATEYTVGAAGRAAMPGTLPPTSGYTFAAELSIDEALAAGATGVQFSQPVIVYVENFIHMPVGATVPSGSLDRSTGRWVAEPDGRALKILAITGGVASIDANGDGTADDDTALTALGIDMDERSRLGEIYTVGQELWRVPTNHFSACDYNSPDGPPAGAAPPGQPDYKPIEHACDTKGSIVACQEQVLKEDAAVKGTPYHLRYSSERVPGHGTGSDLVVRVTSDVVPNGIKGIAVQASIAGRLFEQYYAPGSDPASGVGDVVPNITWTIPWDGLDAYNRPVQGTTPIFIRTNYVYPAVRYETNDKAYQAFGGYADPNLPYPALNACITIAINGMWSNPYASPWCGFNLKRDEVRGVSTWDAREAGGLGGWTLDVHHSYDPVQKAIRLGDGTTERSNAAAAVVRTVAGGGSTPFPAANGGPARSADLDQLEDVAVGPDGTIFGIQQPCEQPRRAPPRRQRRQGLRHGGACQHGGPDRACGRREGTGLRLRPRRRVQRHRGARGSRRHGHPDRWAQLAGRPEPDSRHAGGWRGGGRRDPDLSRGHRDRSRRRALRRRLRLERLTAARARAAHRTRPRHHRHGGGRRHRRQPRRGSRPRGSRARSQPRPSERDCLRRPGTDVPGDGGRQHGGAHRHRRTADPFRRHGRRRHPHRGLPAAAESLRDAERSRGGARRHGLHPRATHGPIRLDVGPGDPRRPHRDRRRRHRDQDGHEQQRRRARHQRFVPRRPRPRDSARRRALSPQPLRHLSRGPALRRLRGRRAVGHLPQRRRAVGLRRARTPPAHGGCTHRGRPAKLRVQRDRASEQRDRSEPAGDEHRARRQRPADRDCGPGGRALRARRSMPMDTWPPSATPRVPRSI